MSNTSRAVNNGDGQGRPPDRADYVAECVLCLVGIVVGIQLTRIHFLVRTDPKFTSFCAISDAVNCDTVSLSPQSVLLGVPVSIWGIAFYAALLVMAFVGLRAPERERPRMRGLILLAAAWSVAYSVYLVCVSAFVVRSFCILCMALQLVNLLMLAAAVLGRVRSGETVLRALKGDARFLLDHPYSTAAAGAIFISVLALVAVYYPVLCGQNKECKEPAKYGDLPTGETADGLPWIGSAAPEVTIVEFSDYQCPFCSMAHFVAREAVAAHRWKVRLVHRHFPLDHQCNPVVKSPFHLNACLAARAAVCAQNQGLFWPVNDQLYRNQKDLGPLQVRRLAKEAGIEREAFEKCLESEGAASHLRRDIEKGVELKIKGTPMFLVGDEPRFGAISPDELDRLIRSHLKE